jgi:Ca2+-binding RTX toxin-like protein
VELPTEDGGAEWRVEVDLIDDPAFADDPYEPVPYDETPASADPGWYAGDVHVHARNSAPGDATMRETFDYAFAPFGQGAGLDFITLSDYVTDRSWGEIGAFQADYPGKVIVRSSEVITYRGHINNHGGGEYVDYRTGAIYEGQLTGGSGSGRQLTGLEQVRPAQQASRILQDIRDGGGWNQLNHVETFPSEIPTFGNLCRGCSWSYSDGETDYRRVDSIEVATGPAGLEIGPVDPGPNPFTPLALAFYEDALDANGANRNRIAAVGSSDSHNAGGADNPLTQAPIGTAQTVVRADELSESGIGEAIAEQHTYVKMWGADGPDLRFEATAPGLAEPAIIGDTVASGQATLTARVFGLDRARAARSGLYTLIVLRNGLPFLALPMPTGNTFEFSFPALGSPSRYSLEVQRIAVGASVEAFSSPIWVDPAGDPEDPGQPPDPPDPPDPPAACAEAPVLKLTSGADDFQGTDAADRVRGLRGADRLRGAGGNDCLTGNRGRDRLRGDAGTDRLAGGRGSDRVRGGAGTDRLAGGRGSDRIGALDGRRDVVRCGRGKHDRARVDRRLDRVRGCERVRRV